MRATASSEPGRSRAQSSRTEYSCKPIGILAMGFPFEWGQAPGRSSTKDTKGMKDTRGLDSGKHCSCGARKDRNRFARKRERAKARKGWERGEARQWPDHSLYPFPLSG